MLPTMDGIEVCRRIREIDEVTPVLFLTAKDGVEDTINGLRTGDTTTSRSRSPLRNSWSVSRFTSGTGSTTTSCG